MKTSSIIVGAAVLTYSLGAFGQTMEKKAPPPAKPAETKAAPPPKEEPKPAMPAGPPKEVADMAKSMAGTWKCAGSAMGPDGNKIEFKGTTKSKLDLDKWWIQMNFDAPKTKTGPGYKGTSFRTFDGKKWHQVSVDSMGGYAHSWTTGPDAAGKTTWEGEGGMMGMTAKSKDYEEWKTPNKELHIWGEMSMDGGKTWMPVYDMTCKK